MLKKFLRACRCHSCFSFIQCLTHALGGHSSSIKCWLCSAMCSLSQIIWSTSPKSFRTSQTKINQFLKHIIICLYQLRVLISQLICPAWHALAFFIISFNSFKYFSFTGRIILAYICWGYLSMFHNFIFGKIYCFIWMFCYLCLIFLVSTL